MTEAAEEEEMEPWGSDVAEVGFKVASNWNLAVPAGGRSDSRLTGRCGGEGERCECSFCMCETGRSKWKKGSHT